MSKLDQNAWRKTVIVLSIISLIVGVLQRTTYQFLKPIFELCIFHLSTIMSILIYLNKYQ